MADKLVVCCSSVEDRDSSSESGLSSNWWVLGSQGRDPLSATGDSTLQTLSQFTLSSLGAQSVQQSQSDESEHKNDIDESTEQSHRESSERAKDENGSNEKQADAKNSFLPPEKNQIKEDRERREHKQSEQDENATNDKGISITCLHVSFRYFMVSSLYREQYDGHRSRAADATSITSARCPFIHRTILFGL